MGLGLGFFVNLEDLEELRLFHWDSGMFASRRGSSWENATGSPLAPRGMGAAAVAKAAPGNLGCGSTKWGFIPPHHHHYSLLELPKPCFALGEHPRLVSLTALVTLRAWTRCASMHPMPQFPHRWLLFAPEF